MGAVPLVPYVTPGTDALADSCEPYIDRYDAFLMANHGATTLGATLDVAHQRMESLEHAARIIARRAHRWVECNELSASDVAALRSVARGTPMTDSNRSLNEVPALLDERRRYEGWLAALDARRESTPKHVFERVQADYKTRLQRVAERLASHRSAIEEERASVQSRLSLLEAEEQLRRDERAELELRAHVGELVGDEARSRVRAGRRGDRSAGRRKEWPRGPASPSCRFF